MCWVVFIESKIHGHQFLQLTISDLSKVPRASLGYREKRRLVHAIQELRPTHSHTSAHTHKQANDYDPILQTHNTRAYQDRMQARPPLQPYLVTPPRTTTAHPTFGSARPMSQPSTEDSDYARIRPYIPERISSTPEQISRIMKTLNVTQIRPMGPPNRGGRPVHHYMPGPPTLGTGIVMNSGSGGINGRYRQSNPTSDRLNSPNSPRMLPGDHESKWKLTGRRVHKIQEHPQPLSWREQRIQVTADSDTFFSLVVTDIVDVEHIKQLILKKIGLEGESDQYSFFHENGNRHDVPLVDNELVHLCRISDSSSKDRVLVRPLEGHHYNSETSRSYSTDRSNTGTLSGIITNQYSRAPAPVYQHYTHYSGDVSPTQANWSSVFPDSHDPQRRHPSHLQADRASPHISPISLTSPVSRLQLVDPASYPSEALSFVHEYHYESSTPPAEDAREEEDFDYNNKRSSSRSLSTDHSTSSFHDTTPSHSNTTEAWTSMSHASSSTEIYTDEPYQRQLRSSPTTLWAMAPNGLPEPIASYSETTDDASECQQRGYPWQTPPRPHTSSSSEKSCRSLYSAWPACVKPQTTSSARINGPSTRNSVDLPSHSPAVSLWAIPPTQQQQHQQYSSPPQTAFVGERNSTPPTIHVENNNDIKPSVSLWAIAPKSQAPQADEPNPPEVAASSQHPNSTPQVSLWATPPSGLSSGVSSTAFDAFSGTSSGTPLPTSSAHPPVSLWAVTPSAPPSATSSATSTSLWAVAPSAPPSTSPSLWAIRPSTAPSHTSSSSPSPSPSLWAVAPSSSTTSSTATPSPQQASASVSVSVSVPVPTPSKSVLWPTEDQLIKEDTHSQPIGSPHKGLHIDIPPLPSMHPSPSLFSPSAHTQNQNQNPLLPQSQAHTRLHPSSASISSSPQSTTHEAPHGAGDDDDWANRPSIEKLYRDIDKYLPDYDLDKEIIVEAPPSTVAPASRRALGPKKSVRVLANEAHRNWRQAMNVIRVNNNLRRRGTKMWGQKVEQVKPGQLVEAQTLGREAMSDNYMDKLVPTKMQWIRGGLIGKGSFGRVYHAMNLAADGEWFAVKQVDLPTSKSDLANPEMRKHVDSLYREIALLENLVHDNIVQYLGYDADEEEGHLHIFLEYVPGGSIASCLHKSGRFDEPLVRFFTRQILLGLEYLHDRNVLHRDIKAGNILLDQNGVCKITDFGLSKVSGQDKAYDPNGQNSIMRGTIFWMAPEVVNSAPYSAKIDIWSLGCTVIEMLTGSHPWLDLNTLAALYSLGKHQAPPIPQDISEHGNEFLQLCFTIDPVERPTAADLLVHPFVRQDPTFKFKEYMKIKDLERKASQRSIQQ
ncbi:hypothetical protein BDF14DRAFT_1744347 [Spinellus fusiger]|nr:hypothetical protein BDF14DRAFT_1744347 [Spinellus fusiger]